MHRQPVLSEPVERVIFTKAQQVYLKRTYPRYSTARAYAKNHNERFGTAWKPSRLAKEAEALGVKPKGCIEREEPDRKQKKRQDQALMFTAEQDDIIRRFYATGASKPKITALLNMMGCNVTESAVQVRASKLGATSRRRDPELVREFEGLWVRKSTGTVSVTAMERKQADAHFAGSDATDKPISWHRMKLSERFGRNIAFNDARALCAEYGVVPLSLIECDGKALIESEVRASRIGDWQ